MSENSKWVDEQNYCELRESGDGESKETSPHISASEEDNHDFKQSIDNRKVERKKEKKTSKIPVRQTKAPYQADADKSTYGNSCRFEQSGFGEKVDLSCELFDDISDKSTSLVVDNTQTDPAFDEEITNFKGVDLSDSIKNNYKVAIKEDDRTNQDHKDVLEIDAEQSKSEIKGDSKKLGDKSPHLIDTNQISNLSFCEQILEAPEEFRCEYLNLEKDDRFVRTDVGEPKHCRSSAAVRDHVEAIPPEVMSESNKDAASLEVEIEISLNRLDVKSRQICMTNEGKHDVIELVESNVNECAKFAAPIETIEIIHNVRDGEGVFTDTLGGEVKDNDQIIQSDSINASETIASVCDNCNLGTCSTDVGVSICECADTVTRSHDMSAHFNKNVADEKFSISCDLMQTKFDTYESEPDVTLSNVYEPRADNSCSGKGRDSVNGANSLVSNIGAFACAGNEQTPTTTKASIAIGVARCAQAPRCSRISTATVCAVSASDSSNLPTNSTQLNENVTEELISETKSSQIIDDDASVDLNSTYSPSGKTESVNSDEGAREDFDEKIDNSNKHLVWDFKNGRLVFEAPEPQLDENQSGPTEPHIRSGDLLIPPLLRVIDKCAKTIEKSLNVIKNETESEEVKTVLCSRDLNKRVVEGRSRLKHLENKLKEAGITDGKSNSCDFNQSERENCKNKLGAQEISENTEERDKQVVDKLTATLDNVNFDDNQNVICLESCGGDLKSENENLILSDDLDGGLEESLSRGSSNCEFDVRQISSFNDFRDSDFYVVYDELDDCSEDDCEHEHYNIIGEMRGDGSMGTNGERIKQHNPDRENLKSLLKKPGRSRDVKKNRVVFNENKNEFFDADYIILIREECDYDDEEDDGVCTCNEHEMVRLTCCEPNCNCNIYDGYSEQTPQSPKFAPPLEFVDAVTLSPPEGYKDMELGEQQLLALQQMARRGQRTAVCRDCSATHEDEGEGSQSDNEDNCEAQSDHEDNKEETHKTDQSQQTTPTTPPALDSDNTNQHPYILETVSVTTSKEKRTTREAEDDKLPPSSPCLPQTGSPISGILKGGRLWKQHSQEINNAKNIEQPATDSSVTSDEESNGNKRSVRFTETSENKRDSCDGAPEKSTEETSTKQDEIEEKQENCPNSISPESTEMMLTFKLGNHILISNNSLKPNSAVRQLFPCSKPLSNKPGDNDSVHQYLVTAESLRAFEEAKRSKLPQIIQSDETDESIKKAIERNTLRRSLIRYEPRPKKKEQKTDNSLIERIKQLTCDVDDVAPEEDISQRGSPPGEEARKSPEMSQLTVKNNDKSFSPSSSSTASSNSSSVSSTYKKITDLFAKREKPPDVQNLPMSDLQRTGQVGPAPDLGNAGNIDLMAHQSAIVKGNPLNDSRKQFLSTLAPLTACVSGTGPDDHFYHLAHHVGDRSSVTSSVGTEYSLEDIDEGLKKEDDDSKRNAPDVVVGTPCASESGDELAMFVQQDAGRIERIKKKYQQDNTEDDEHDDYGFNKRPSVRGIKPRFGTTNEILQQIQSQMQPPHSNQKVNTQINWPYYSEASLSNLDNNKSRNINQNLPQYQYTYLAEEMKTKMYVQQYRPPFVDENLYQNCANQRCNRGEATYKTNVNHVHSPVMRVGSGCGGETYHQVVPNKARNGRPESPPPFDVAKTIHQTMVYIPYNHIESYQPGCVSPNPQYVTNDKCYARVVNQNQINNRYIEPIYLNQPRMNHPHPVGADDAHYQVNVMKQMPKPVMRLPYPLPPASGQQHMISSRSESPLPGQFSTARSTQTAAPVMSTCNNYYPRYRPVIGPVVAHAGISWNAENVYSNKINRHSFPAGMPRYPAPDSISLTDSESQYSSQVPNGFRQCIETTFPVQRDSAPSSPTKTRFIERGVPEGAASVSPQDNATAVSQSTSTMTSPTSPQNPGQGNSKPMFYAMNV